MAFLPLLVLAMAFDLLCAISVLGWIVLVVMDTTATARTFDLLQRALSA